MQFVEAFVLRWNIHNKIVFRMHPNIFKCIKIRLCNKNKRNVKFSVSNEKIQLLLD